MGEFEFIESIARNFEGIGDAGIEGMGDDCAVIPVRGGNVVARNGADSGSEAGSSDEALVLTADMLVENVHFLRAATSPRELGAKSLAVNLSDVAAMGARPVASLLSIALPPECRGEWSEQFMEGYRELSARYGVKLAGGDTTASKGGIAINVTAIGRAPLDRLKYRNGVRPGDVVAVCGPLGESAAGLNDIMQDRLDTRLAWAHRNPVPQVEEGIWLGGRTEVHSMIDLSDGLASDLVHILKASGCSPKTLGKASGCPRETPGKTSGLSAKPGTGLSADAGAGYAAGLYAEIEITAIPTSVSPELAATGGEDYKLLITASPDGFERLRADYRSRFGDELYPIGRIVSGTPGIVWTENGTPVSKNWHGFVHF